MWEKVNQVLTEAQVILEDLQSYRGAGEEIRQVRLSTRTKTCMCAGRYSAVRESDVTGNGVSVLPVIVQEKRFLTSSSEKSQKKKHDAKAYQVKERELRAQRHENVFLDLCDFHFLWISA